MCRVAQMRATSRMLMQSALWWQCSCNHIASIISVNSISRNFSTYGTCSPFQLFMSNALLFLLLLSVERSMFSIIWLHACIGVSESRWRYPLPPGEYLEDKTKRFPLASRWNEWILLSLEQWRWFIYAIVKMDCIREKKNCENQIYNGASPTSIVVHPSSAVDFITLRSNVFPLAFTLCHSHIVWWQTPRRNWMC